MNRDDKENADPVLKKMKSCFPDEQQIQDLKIN
jgi:hypothetical protein